MGDSIFSHIMAGDVPGYIIYENDYVCALLDINPVNPGHTLIVPKKETSMFTETDQEELNEMIKAAKKITKALMKVDGVKGVNILCNNGAGAGQQIFHTHFHLIPRYENDGHAIWQGKPYAQGKADEMKNIIKQNIE